MVLYRRFFFSSRRRHTRWSGDWSSDVCSSDLYQAETKDLAEHNLLLLEEKWGNKYPMVLRSWQEKWDHLSAYFKYSPQLRKLIYTTNPIEGFHRQIRKYTKTKGAFTNENALFKLMFCAIKRISEKWDKPIPNWALTISQLDIFFPGRINFGKWYDSLDTVYWTLSSKTRWPTAMEYSTTQNYSWIGYFTRRLP